MCVYPYFMVSFRIMGDELNPKKVTELLHIKPEKSHKKNDRNEKLSKSGKVMRCSLYKSGLWTIESSIEKEQPLEDHLLSILSLLEPKKEQMHELYDLGYCFDMYCGMFTNSSLQNGISINHQLMKKMSDLHITFGIDIYLLA